MTVGLPHKVQLVTDLDAPTLSPIPPFTMLTALATPHHTHYTYQVLAALGEHVHLVYSTFELYAASNPMASIFHVSQVSGRWPVG